MRTIAEATVGSDGVLSADEAGSGRTWDSKQFHRVPGSSVALWVVIELVSALRSLQLDDER
jgi:hypothetical protein